LLVIETTETSDHTD